MKRVIIIVLDSVGIGNAPDAAAFGDEGANTLVNLSRAAGSLRMPNMQALGLGNILSGQIEGCPAVSAPAGSYGRMIEASNGKDTTIGHWEMAGIITTDPFPTFPDGFPIEFMQQWANDVGVEGWLCNLPASGTEIVRQLGELHCQTGLPIVYTSADSVFQIAAHEEHFGLQRLYDICAHTRKMLDPLRVGRVIARPFVGESADTFVRTANRHDYSLVPPTPNALTLIRKAGCPVFSIGKIKDVFAGVGISDAHPTRSNLEGMKLVIDALPCFANGLIFANLVEFDSSFGHRRDTAGYARCLEEFDAALGELIPRLAPNDLLLITADHGNDPTFKGTDHTREMVPLISFSPKRKSEDLGVRTTFADLGATACAWLGAPMPKCGTPFV
ncbi:phosphopentomutase [bacterium]|nr:phosphopentomutase [bacterium]